MRYCSYLGSVIPLKHNMRDKEEHYLQLHTNRSCAMQGVLCKYKTVRAAASWHNLRSDWRLSLLMCQGLSGGEEAAHHASLNTFQTMQNWKGESKKGEWKKQNEVTSGKNTTTSSTFSLTNLQMGFFFVSPPDLLFRQKINTEPGSS